MSINFSDRPYRTQAWDAVSELTGFLSRCDAGSVFLASELEAPIRLFSITLYLAGERERFGIGVASSNSTGLPHLLLKPELSMVMVGMDRQVHGVDLESGTLSFSRTCDGHFTQFVEVADASVTLVFHTLGVVALAEDGWELWRKDVSPIIDWACEEGTLFLRLQDAPTIRVSVRNGSPIEGGP